MKLHDIIELSDVRLVIDIDDADRDPRGISDTFILTEEVERGLRGILERIDANMGCGVFVKGNYGSGKSHFLSFLYLLLKDKSHPLLKDYKAVRETPYRLIKISLVRYPASLSLEGIVLQCLDYKGRVSDREALYREIFQGPAVIIIDELSEFLRSKPAPPQFYEDVRFLQFLGEFSMKYPLWVVASLQEWIEETGHISSSIFNRIKDRYPLRINLTSSHIEDIIDQRLVIKREGSLDVIKDVFDRLKRFYPYLDLSFDRFKKSYPLHPITTRYLSGLTRIFSQHRGVIQFVQQEVLKRLNDPPDSLVTAEAIFDCFEDRIREIPEYSGLARIVYEYYRNNLPAIFNNQLQRDIAKDVLKILILTEISPLEKRKTAKDLSEILLKKISTVKEDINYEYIRNGILEPLVSHQMYVMKEGETFFIDLSQDEGLRIKARIKAVRDRFIDRDYLFGEIANLLSLPYLPLKEIKETRRYRFNWQNSLRECLVLLSQQICRDDIDRFVEGIKKRVDGYLVLLSPFHKFSLSSQLFSDLPELSLIFLWQPREFTEEEIHLIEEYVAKAFLSSEFPSLKESLKNSYPLFRDTITKVYFDGSIYSADGKEEVRINDIGYLPMERLLNHLFDSPFRSLYPEHQRIMPRIDIYSSSHVTNLFNHFIKHGRITIEEAEKKGLVPFIKGLLEPLGIVNKRSTAYLLHISADNDLISYILDLIAREREVYNLRLNLKRSRWGLSDDQINILLSSLIVSGYAIPYEGQGPCDFIDISQLSSGGFYLKPGKAIDPELLRAVPKGRFIWGETETVPGSATIRAMWKAASAFIRKYRRLIGELQSMINRYKEYSIFRFINLDMPILNRLALFVHSIGLNESAQEGIERFLLYLKENEDLENQVSYIERLYRFFDEEFPLINKYYLYLTHPSLKTDNDLREVKESLIREIEGAIANLTDLEGIRRGWTEFYDSYCSLYKDSHDRFYSAPIFRLREIEDSQEVRALKRIAYSVTSLTFEGEWWDIKRRIEGLPVRCNADLNQELFLNPVCLCGFQIGSEPPESDLDLQGLCQEGLRNFVKTLQLPEHREKIDSTITGLSISGKKDQAERLLQILNLHPKKASINQIVFLLDEGVLQEIENTFKGRWQIKEIILEELIEKIKGRRFRHDELKRLILNWIGDDTESIIHVKSMDSEEGFVSEGLSLYGLEGRKAQIELINKGGAYSNTASEDLIRVFDGINLRNFENSQLMEFLMKEKNEYMKKRLRNELFERAWNLNEEISMGTIHEGLDKAMAEILKAIYLIKRCDISKGIVVFTHNLAVVSNILESLFYKNLNQSLIDHELLQRLHELFLSLFKDYEKRPDRFNGARDLGYIKERLSGTVVIMDGLRYDLWLILKDVFIHEGWRIKEEVFMIDLPSTTNNFMDAIGIGSDSGMIDGKVYSIMKVAEREIGKRNLRKFLKEAQGIRFLHFNFIDTRIHGSTLDLYPLYEIIKKEVATAIVPIFKELGSFYLLSDHGFRDTKELKERYRHGGKTIWETVLPFAEIKL